MPITRACRSRTRYRIVESSDIARDFTLRFEWFGHGSVQVLVRAGDCEVLLWPSFLSPALPDLARATIALLRSPVQKRITFSWQDEPGEWRWVLLREDEALVQVRILEFSENFSPLPDEQGIVLCEVHCSLQRFATQVHAVLHRVLRERDEEGFFWGGDAFPTREREELGLLLQERKITRLGDLPEAARRAG